MARKNIFDNLIQAEEQEDVGEEGPVTGFRRFGAAKSISSSIDELARQASQLVEGQAVLDIDPALVDGSFVSDRMASDDEAYRELLNAIRERGQDTPVLLRPNPEKDGHYQVVFGHRRVMVARELKRPVRAVVKSLSDIEHVIAQGQENSARANLTFIERVLFARRLSELGYTREIIQSALSADYQTLSKMLTIPKAIPESVIEAIGPARGVGRDRWLELRKLVENPKNTGIALEYTAGAEFEGLGENERFDALFNLLKGDRAKKPVKKAIEPKQKHVWKPGDEAVVGTISSGRNTYNLSLKSRDAQRFGKFISGRLDELYRDFRELEDNNTGE